VWTRTQIPRLFSSYRSTYMERAVAASSHRRKDLRSQTWKHSRWNPSSSVPSLPPQSFPFNIHNHPSIHSHVSIIFVTVKRRKIHILGNPNCTKYLAWIAKQTRAHQTRLCPSCTDCVAAPFKATKMMDWSSATWQGKFPPLLPDADRQSYDDQYTALSSMRRPHAARVSWIQHFKTPSFF
jgi:hypothetical protein